MGARKRYVAQIARSALKSLLGENSVYVLEYQLYKRLGRDVYEVFYEEPHSFYQALTSLFGSGTGAILRILGERLIDGGCLEVESPREFVEAFKNPGGDGRGLWRMFKIGEGRG